MKIKWKKLKKYYSSKKTGVLSVKTPLIISRAINA